MPAVPPSAFSMEDANARFNNGFPALVGLHFLEWVEGRAVLGLRVRQEHLNLGGVIHGGVLATLMDVAGACAGTYCPHHDRIRKAVTLSMTTTFSLSMHPLVAHLSFCHAATASLRVPVSLPMLHHTRPLT